jgi:hypothetical protein
MHGLNLRVGPRLAFLRRLGPLDLLRTAGTVDRSDEHFKLTHYPDPWGRRVVLTSSGWVHVLHGHPDMAWHIEATLTTVRHPDAITPDPIRGRWRYWRSGAGPTRCLFVVVDWHEAPPEVVTAFGRRRVRL